MKNEKPKKPKKLQKSLPEEKRKRKRRLKKTGKIKPKYWYVIYEDELLKPKVLNYRFIEYLFAKQYAITYLESIQHNILQGMDLIKLGITENITLHRNKQIKNLIGSKTKAKSKYFFPDGLSEQRRKTLRTMYRYTKRKLKYGKGFIRDIRKTPRKQKTH